jgi:hypothetical protein
MEMLLAQLRISSAFQEPPDKSDPQTIEKIAVEYLPDTKQDEKESYDTSDGSRNGCSSVKTMCDSPYESAEDSTAVQWETWDQVKESQRAVDISQILGQGQYRGERAVGNPQCSHE